MALETASTPDLQARYARHSMVLVDGEREIERSMFGNWIDVLGGIAGGCNMFFFVVRR